MAEICCNLSHNHLSLRRRIGGDVLSDLIQLLPERLGPSFEPEIDLKRPTVGDYQYGCSHDADE